MAWGILDIGGNIGIVEKKMEDTIVYFEYIGNIGLRGVQASGLLKQVGHACNNQICN